MNTQSQKPILKKKAENPNAPFKDESDSSVRKLHKWWYNNRYYYWNLNENFFQNFPIRNMLQSNFSHAIFFREGVMSRNRIIHRLWTSMLDTL